MNLAATARILVVRGGAIGDFIQTLPAIGTLRQRWPGAHLEVLGYPRIAVLAKHPAYADAIRSIESRAVAAFFAPAAALDPDWQRYFGSFDLVLSYLYDPDQVFAVNVRRCGVQQLVQGTPHPQDCQAAMHYCQPLSALGLAVTAPLPRVYPAEPDRQFAREYLDGVPRERLVAIHPGSGAARKNWPVDKFAAIAGWLGQQYGAQLLVIEGEADQQPVAQLRAALAPLAVRVVRGLDLLQVAAVLEVCAAFVGNDSGITHLAAAVQTPTVAMFGPASSPLWRPPGRHVQVVRFGVEDADAVRCALTKLLPSA
jgi:heptosyltransferase-2